MSTFRHRFIALLFGSSLQIDTHDLVLTAHDQFATSKGQGRPEFIPGFILEDGRFGQFFVGRPRLDQTKGPIASMLANNEAADADDTSVADFQIVAGSPELFARLVKTDEASTVFVS